MPQRRFAAFVLAAAAVAALAACGSSEDSDTGAASATVDGDLVAVGPAPVPVPGDVVARLGDAVEVAAGTPGQAAGSACPVDRRTLETAVEAYELLTGSLPASQQALLDDRMILELSPNFEVSADGAVIAVPGSPCT